VNLWEIDADAVRNGLDVYIWNASRVRSDFYVSNVVTVGAWSCIDVDFNQAVSGRATVALDGTTIAAVNGDFGGAADYSRLPLWNPGGGSVYVDDVSVTVS
jgi:hypothetical protein